MELNEDYPAMKALGAETLAVAVNDWEGAYYLVKGFGLEFPVLYDPKARVARMYGVYDLLGDGLAAPAVFVLDKEGKIRWRYIGKDLTDRPDNALIIEQLKGLE